jgi:hypothetical protein
MSLPVVLTEQAEADLSEVIAVFHQRRDPSVWQSRA